MSNVVIKLKKEDINYEDLYSGDIKERFPSIKNKRITEFNNFINGIIAINKNLINIDPNLAGALAVYTSTHFFTNCNEEINPLFYFDFFENLNDNKKDCELIANRVRNSFVRTINYKGPNLETRIDNFYSSVASFSKRELKKINNSKIIEINYGNKKIIYPELFKLINIEQIGKFSRFKDQEIVGNKEVTKSLQTVMDFLLNYDIEKKYNSLLDLIEFPKVTTIFGSPGTGKTMCILKALDYLEENCAKRNKPFLFLEVDANTKSEFKSLSERQLKEKFDIAYRGDSINVILIEESDTKVFSRNNIDYRNSSEYSFTGTFMESIEGIQEYLGNFQVIITSNRRLNPDNGLKRRITENILYTTGLESKEDHITVFKNNLKKGLINGYIKVKNWPEIGAKSIKKGFQGGDIKNICVRLYKNVLKGVNFNEYYSDDNKKIIKKMNQINDNIIMKEIDSYYEDSIRFSKDFLKEIN